MQYAIYGAIPETWEDSVSPTKNVPLNYSFILGIRLTEEIPFIASYGKRQDFKRNYLLEEVTKMYAIALLIDFTSYPNICIFMEIRENQKNFNTQDGGKDASRRRWNFSNHLTAHHPWKLLNFSEQVNQSFPASNLIKVVTNWLICKQDE